MIEKFEVGKYYKYTGDYFQSLNNEILYCIYGSFFIIDEDLKKVKAGMKPYIAKDGSLQWKDGE